MPRHSSAPFYRRVIADAWQIAWQHKHLWVFGFFAATIGFGGVSETLFSGSDKVYAQLPGMMTGGDASQALPGMATLSAVVSATSSPVIAVTMFLAIMGVFAAVFGWMTYVSVGALIAGIKKIDRGGDPTFGEGVTLGIERFWTVLGVNVWTSLFVFCCFVLTASAMREFLTSGGVWRGLFYIGAFATFTALSIVASVVAVLATCEAALRKRTVRQSLSAAIVAVGDHWLMVFETGVALFLTSLAIGLTAIAIAAVGSVPFLFLLFVAAIAGARTAQVLIMTCGAAAMIVLIVFAGSFITVYQTAVWTLLWSEISTGRPAPKLLRLARKHLPFLA